MRLPCVLWVACCVLAGGGAPVARADDAPAGAASYRAVVDRVDLEPAAIGGLRLRVSVSALALQGQLLDLSDPRSLKVTVGGTKLDAPFARGVYGAAGGDTALVIVVQSNLAYAETLPGLLTTLDDVVLSHLPDRTQAVVLPYGDGTGTGKLGSLKAARGKLSEVASDGSAGEPALLDTLDRAVLLLKRAKTNPEGRPIRKLIVVIGDGRDRSGDRERVTSLGKKADREGIRIHTLGYAPSNVRRPLLTLGELSKRSQGTFRWIRAGGADSWSGGFQQLRDEILKQAVLTFFLPADAEVSGKKLKVALVGRTEVTSNELKVPDAKCGAEACIGYCTDSGCAIVHLAEGRGVLGWILVVIGVALGVALVLGLIGFVLQRQRVALPPGMAPPPGHVAPGSKPPRPPKPAKAGKPAKHQPVAPPMPVVGPALLVLSGPRTGERIPLLNGFTIGKAPGSTLLLDDGYTSSVHASIVMDQAGTCRLYDRNSTNGTFANGVRITEVVLDHGMSVRIGSTELRFLAQ